MRVRVLLLLAVIFGLGVLVGVIVYTATPRPEPAASEVTVRVAGDDPAQGGTHGAEIEEPDIVAEDIELVQGEGGRIGWKIQAKSARYSEERELVVVNLPQMTAYMGEDRDEVFVRADLGEVDQQGDNLRLWDNVIGRYGLFALRADSLDYIGAMDKVYLKGEVAIERPDISVNATAVEIDVTGRELVAGGGVEALITPEGLQEVMEQ